MSGELVPIPGTETLSDYPGTIVLASFSIVLFVVAIVVSLWRSRARAQFMEAARSRFAALPPAPLVEGPVVLAGIVEANHPELPVVSVELPEDAKWDESFEQAPQFDAIVMRPMARAFTLVLDGTKERVLVQPNADVEVWSRQLHVVRKKIGELSSTIRIAAVYPGERVIVRGQLSRDPPGVYDEGYREHYRGLVVHAAGTERLVIEAESTIAVLEAAAPIVVEWAALVVAAFFSFGAVLFFLPVFLISKNPGGVSVDTQVEAMRTISAVVLMGLVGFVVGALGSYANTWSPWYGPRAYSGFSYRQRG